MNQRDSILGCIVGGAIGDAAGSCFEGTNCGDRSNWLNAPWALTDDTQLTLATCEALSTGPPNPEKIAASMLSWFKARRLRGLGSSTLKALRDLNAGGHWALVGRKGEFAAGNGAAMRIAPLAFCSDPQTASGRQLIRDVSRITHHHDEAYAGALAVILAISGKTIPEIANTHILFDCRVRDRLGALGLVSSIAQAALAGTTGYVVDSVPLALFASLKVAEIGFSGMLEQLILAGGDTDTIASIAGQVAGAKIGFSQIPRHLMERLPELDMILTIADRFSNSLAETSVSSRHPDSGTQGSTHTGTSDDSH